MTREERILALKEERAKIKALLKEINAEIKKLFGKEPK